MKKFLLCTAVLALMAGPAMAQPRHEGERHGATNPSRPAPGARNQQARPPRQTQQQAPRPRPGNQTRHQPDRRVNHQSGRRADHHRSRAGRPHHEWNAWRNQHRNYFNRPARRYHAPRYHRPNGWYYRRWSFGDILPSLFWSTQYWINDYRTYALPPPPPGAMWVRYGDDAILIDRYSGEVIDVIHGIFY